MVGAHAGIRVLDLSRVLAGPWAAQTLADLGAEVIKIERPGSGDDTRGWGPPFLKDASGAETGEAAYFLATNRGKRSLTLDISTRDGQAILKRLAAQSDVLIENYKLGGLKRYGLDYDSLRALNPGLIYVSITGFGQTGPYAHRAGYDFLIQAMCGLMSVTGEADDKPGGGPQKIGVALTDVITGLYATIAIQAALSHRAQTGRGQHVDLALFDAAVASMANQAQNYLATGIAPGRLGNAHPNIVPYQAFAVADGHVILAIGNDSQFAKFCKVAGRADLAEDPRFRANAGRVAHRDVLVPILAEIMAARGQGDWIAALEQAGVPCGPINDMGQVFADPQAIARGLRFDMPHAVAAAAPQIANPIRLSDSPIAYELPPPALGQHTDELLAELLGLSADEIAALKRAGVV